MTDDPVKQPEASSQGAPISWSEAAQPVFANVITSYCDGSTVFLTFGYTDMPLHGPPDGVGIVRLEAVKAIPVIRLGLPLREFRDIVDTLQRHKARIDSYFSTKQDKV